MGKIFLRLNHKKNRLASFVEERRDEERKKEDVTNVSICGEAPVTYRDDVGLEGAWHERLGQWV